MNSMPPIDPHSGNFFLLLLLGTAVAYGIAPEIAPAAVILCFLWGLASYPVVAIALVVAWLLRRLVWDALVALIVGFAGGLGARAAGTFSSPERAEKLRQRYEDQRRRR